MTLFVLLLFDSSDNLCISWDLTFLLVVSLLQSAPVLQGWVGSSPSAIVSAVSFVWCSRTVPWGWIQTRLAENFGPVNFHLSPPVFFCSYRLQSSLKSQSSNSSLERSFQLHLALTTASPVDWSPVKLLKMKFLLRLTNPSFSVRSFESDLSCPRRCFVVVTETLSDTTTSDDHLKLSMSPKASYKVPCEWFWPILPSRAPSSAVSPEFVSPAKIFMMKVKLPHCLISVKCVSYHHSTRLNPPPVNHYMLSFSSSTLLMNVNETLLNYVPNPYSYPLSILWMDGYDIKLGSLNRLGRFRYCNCSPWSKTDPSLLSLGDMHWLLVWCSCLLCRRRFMFINFDLRSKLVSLVLWIENHCHCDAWSVLGEEEFNTDDSLSVTYKGSTLLSAAVFKDGRSLYVISTSDEAISVFRLNVVEIRGLLYDISCLSIMTLIILCLFASAVFIVMLNEVSALVNDSSSVGV